MATLACKPTVRFKTFTPAMLRMLTALYSVARGWTKSSTVVITSANDSTHGETSRHYKDEALDLRVHNQPDDAAVLELAQNIRTELGPAFTVLYEDPGGQNAHLHIQPRKGTTYNGPA